MLFTAPDSSRTDEPVLNDITIEPTCTGPNYEWSNWYSTNEIQDGNDFETLIDHRRLNK